MKVKVDWIGQETRTNISVPVNRAKKEWRRARFGTGSGCWDGATRRIVSETREGVSDKAVLSEKTVGLAVTQGMGSALPVLRRDEGMDTNIRP